MDGRGNRAGADSARRVALGPARGRGDPSSAGRRSVRAPPCASMVGAVSSVGHVEGPSRRMMLPPPDAAGLRCPPSPSCIPPAGPPGPPLCSLRRPERWRNQPFGQLQVTHRAVGRVEARGALVPEKTRAARRGNGRRGQRPTVLKDRRTRKARTGPRCAEGEGQRGPRAVLPRSVPCTNRGRSPDRLQKEPGRVCASVS